MIKKKTASSQRAVKADAAFKKSVDDLTEVIIEDLEAGYQSDLEPFEAYANRIRHQVHANLGEFRHRFMRGYETLLDELEEMRGEDEK